MSKTKFVILGVTVLVVLIFTFKIEVIEVRLDEAGYTYIGSVLTGMLRVNTDNGDTAPCVMAEDKKLYCLSWKE